MSAHYEPTHQDLGCLQIQLFSSLGVKELKCLSMTGNAPGKISKAFLGESKLPPVSMINVVAIYRIYPALTFLVRFRKSFRAHTRDTFNCIS